MPTAATLPTPVTLLPEVTLLPDAAAFAAQPATDADLMARVGAGDRDAFSDLVERHKDVLVAYLARLCGRRDQAEDLAQEAFLRLYRTASRYREEGHLAAFLFRIATNLLRSEERRERRWSFVRAVLGNESVARPTPEPAPGERLEREELQRRVATALARLPIHLKATLVLAEVEGWSLAEIARALGCREGTVKSRRFRARERLRQELAAEHPEVAR